MLNIKFAEATELTEDELMEVSGGMVTLCEYCSGFTMGSFLYNNQNSNLKRGWFDFISNGEKHRP